MPYRTEMVDPEVFVEHLGVTVYHIYKNDDIDEGPRAYWFTTNVNGSDNDGHGQDGTFDVRSLEAATGIVTVGDFDEDATRRAVRKAIESGEVVNPDSPTNHTLVHWFRNEWSGDGPEESDVPRGSLPAGFYIVNPDQGEDRPPLWHGPHPSATDALDYWTETGIYKGEYLLAHNTEVN